MKPWLAAIATLILIACSPTAPKPAAPPVATPAQAAAAPLPSQGLIPAPFLGEWNEDAKDCGFGENSSRMIVKPDRIDFYEGAGKVKAASVAGRILTVTLEIATPEDGTLTETLHYEIAADGTTLSDTAEGHTFVRHRCPN